MKRWFTTALLTALILAIGLPLFLRGPDGRPLMSFADLVRVPATALNEAWRGAAGSMSTLADAVGADTTTDAAAAPVVGARTVQGRTQLVKYRNEHGNWVYALSAPEGVEAVPVELDPAAVTVLDRDWVRLEAPADAPAPLTLPTNPFEGYGAAPQLMEEAVRLRETLNARTERLDRLVEGEAP